MIRKVACKRSLQTSLRYTNADTPPVGRIAA